MDKTSQRLGRQDWILAGFRALVAGGVPALRVEPVARLIGATKGSFYWHFAGPEDWRDAMLAFWKQAALTDIIEALAPQADGLARLRSLIRLASTLGRDPVHGGAMAEPGLRSWAQGDPVVAAAVRVVDDERHSFLAHCLIDAGMHADSARLAARLIYAAHIGQQALNQDPEKDIADLDHLIDCLVR